MTFLQPLILFALPLVGLPILIHLINQNRHRTIHWAATMFLLQARRMASGMARLRYILILLARMLAVAGLIFAISRPMAGGWLGLTAGGAPELTIVILDRSVSMEEEDSRTGQSKRATAIEKLSDVLRQLGRTSRIVLFDSATGKHHELASAEVLAGFPATLPTATATDIPALLESVTDYILSNEAGRTDIWICSDLRQRDWDPSGGRWEAVRTQLRDRDGIRFYLLSYQDLAPDNLAVSISGVHRRESNDGAELVMDIKLTRTAATTQPIRVPVTLVIGGARSTIDLELTGTQLIRNGHTIPIDRESRRGWGRVELPRDSNASDNLYHFAFAESAVQKTVIVSDDQQVAEFLRLAAATPSNRNLTYQAEIVPATQASVIDWNATALVLWHAPLPSDVLARQLESFVDAGGCIIFFPPESPTEDLLFGARWKAWKDAESGTPFAVSRWRTDADLLANSVSGAPLPVGQVLTYRCCEVETNHDRSIVLAQLERGPPLLIRAAADRGAVWYCSTLPTTSHSNLVTNGVAFYVMIQRAIARGAAVLGKSRQYECGTLEASAADSWKPLDDAAIEVPLSQRTLNGGLYESTNAVIALNRPLDEDDVAVVTEGTLEQVFSGLDFTRIDDQAGSAMALANEVWRTFLTAMIVALIAESLLCVPDRRTDALPERNRSRDTSSLKSNSR